MTDHVERRALILFFVPLDNGKQNAMAAHRNKGPRLTPTERRLWDTLRAEPGRAFSRAELVAHVMRGTLVLERTIDVHVKALRQKLGPLGERVRTVRSVGYRYVSSDKSEMSGGA
jgi:two-component system, OmpR family, phosphate regulon response regulator PhoB